MCFTVGFFVLFACGFCFGFVCLSEALSFELKQMCLIQPEVPNLFA